LALIAPDGGFGGQSALALRLIEVSDDGKFTVDFTDELFDINETFVFGLLLKPMTQLGQANGAHITAAALETMGSFHELRGIVSVTQQIQTLFGIGEKGIQQCRILILHDFLQRAQYVSVQMWVNHLLTP
jgi:hypothetical protein